EDYVPNLSSRLEDEDGNAFFYLAIIQSPYLSEHVNIGRSDFDFSAVDDADFETMPLDQPGLIPRAEIRNKALEFIQKDLGDNIDDYEEYHRRFSQFLDDYNELGISALAQYVGHRKIIMDFLERAITLPPGADARYPLEEVVHKLVFPMQTTNLDIPYNEQN